MSRDLDEMEDDNTIEEDFKDNESEEDETVEFPECLECGDEYYDTGEEFCPEECRLKYEDKLHLNNPNQLKLDI